MFTPPFGDVALLLYRSPSDAEAWCQASSKSELSRNVIAAGAVAPEFYLIFYIYLTICAGQCSQPVT
jgi:hypothetical protein